MKSVNSVTRIEAKLKANGFCYLCGLELKLYPSNIDHIKPLCKGGTNHINNLIYVHSACNFKKGGKLNTPQQNEKLTFILNKKSSHPHGITTYLSDFICYPPISTKPIDYSFYECNFEIGNSIKLLHNSMP
jgi:hypothetical protein